jgi:hypothetical protein
MPKTLAFRKCPCCGWRLPVVRKGSSARLRGVEVEQLVQGAPIGHLDPETVALIQFQECQGGRGRGFGPVVDQLTIEQAAQDPAWESYTAALFAWARKLAALASRLGK